MKLFVAGISYKTAPVETREQLAVMGSLLPCCGCRLKIAGNLAEVVLVSTCNRVEIYGVTQELKGNMSHLLRQLSGADADFSSCVYLKEGKEAVAHLFSVCSGLDSMVLGETEITGQVKQAYQAAQGAKLAGRVTHRLFQTALQTAKEIRSQTGIGRGATSVGSAAVELAERIFDRDLSQKTIMIIGAGKMGEACVRRLHKRAARALLVTNRSHERALYLAKEFGGRAVEFDALFSAMAEADIVISSTGCPEVILRREDIGVVMTARRNKPLFLIDIAVPRDIAAEVQQLSKVYLYNIDHLEAIVRENVKCRQRELARCEAIIAERTEALMRRLHAILNPDGASRQRYVTDWVFSPALACST